MRKSYSLSFFKVVTLALMLFLPLYDFFVLSPIFTDFVIENLEQDSQQTAIHLGKMVSVNAEEISLSSINNNLGKVATGFLEDFKVRKVKVFSRSGETIFSTDKADLGKIHPDKSLWQHLSDGKTYSKTIKVNRFSLEGEIFPSDVVETYVPIIRNQELIGAIEIYSDISQRRHSLNRLSVKLNLFIIAAMLLLGAAFLIVNEKETRLLKERQASREQLTHAKEEWEKTFDSIEDVIAIIDLDLNITRINRAGMERAGQPYDRIIGQKCYKILRGENEPCQDCNINKVLAEETPMHCLLDTPVKGNAMSITISPLYDHENNIEGFVHIARDVTRQKMLEQRMIRNQKIESLSVLTTGVAHNFRNVLARILMNSQVLQGYYPDDDKVKEVTRWINEAVESGSRLVKNLMQFSRRKIKEEFQTIDLVQILPDAYELLRSSIGKNIDFSFAGPESLLIKGEYSAILQVFINICSNAIDAMRSGGSLHIQLSRDGHQAVVMITDTGMGIEQVVLNKIFEPFFTTKDVDKGTGLGLSSSYGIISEHGGDITVESEPGKGTTFTITLPLLEDKTDEARLTSLEDIEGGLPRKILIIDDEEQALVPMVRLLEISGYEASGTTDTAKALEKVMEWQPDIVFIDYNMPEKDGLTLAEELHELEPSIKIIMLSGSALGDLGINMSDNKYSFITRSLVKPAGIKELTKAIDYALAAN